MKNFGLIGENISYSLSPYIYNYLFNWLSDIDPQFKDCHYSLIDISEDKLSTILEELQKQNFIGINITRPYKQILGKSNNCLKLANDHWEYFNTDKLGLIYSCRKNCSMPQVFYTENIIILGTGTMSKMFLEHLGILNNSYYFNIYIGYNNYIPLEWKNVFECKKMEFFDINNYVCKDIYNPLIVNCTPLGFDKKDKFNLNFSQLKGKAQIFDLTYNLKDLSYLNKIAILNGWKYYNGIDMLAAQAEENFKIWFPEYKDKNILSIIYQAIENYKNG